MRPVGLYLFAAAAFFAMSLSTNNHSGPSRWQAPKISDEVTLLQNKLDRFRAKEQELELARVRYQEAIGGAEPHGPAQHLQALAYMTEANEQTINRLNRIREQIQATEQELREVMQAGLILT